MNKPVKIIIAGGGTGGHLFPGIAIADSFMAADLRNQVLFAGTDKPFEKEVLAAAGYPHVKITAAGIKGMGVIAGVKALLKIPLGILESCRIIKTFKPDMVIGVGGYSSGPLVMAAHFMGIPTALHEQNSLPGITNRILSRFTDSIYISFPDTKARFNPKKVCLTGNPVRKDILNIRENREQIPKKPFTVLIVGGSQGAHRINTTMMNALNHLKDHGFHFIHQTGIHDLESVKEAYKNSGVSCIVQPFFKDMARQYRQADLIICRAGATTVAEIAVLGKGVIFIPFPFAADDHQAVNARSLADKGAADMILEKDLGSEKLADKIKYYASSPDILKNMAAKAKKCGKPDAAEKIVQNSYKLITDKSKFECPP